MPPRPTPSMPWLARATLAVALVLSCAACPSSKPASASRAPDGGPLPKAEKVAIRAAKIESRRIPRVVRYTGSLATPEDTTIAAEVEGKLVEVLADLGDRVGRGQVLARVDPEEFRLRLELAEGLSHASETARERVRKLADEKLVPMQQMDDLHSAANRDRVNAELARKKLRDAEVRAPYAGAIARRLVSPGEYVRPGQPLFEVVALDPLKVTGEVPERWLSDVQSGAPVEAVIDGLDRRVSGKVGRISPAVNEKTRAFTVEARLPNPRGELKPGLFARIEVRLGDAEALVVPEVALSTFAGVTRIYTVEDGVAHERPVEVLEHLERGGAEGSEPLVAVRGERLHAGDTVATSTLSRLAEGVAVSIK